MITPRQRLLRVLGGQAVDRPPVICTGGSMGAVTTEVLALSGLDFRAAHLDPHAMAEVALAAARLAGFESVGVPLCTTVEAEALGSAIDLGDNRVEPRIVKEAFPSIEEARLAPLEELLQAERVRTAAVAARHLRGLAPELPVIGNLIGPVSVAASIVDPLTFMKQLRTRREAAHRLLGEVSQFLVGFGRLMIELGVDALAIHEDTGGSKIIGPRLYAQFTVPYLNLVTGSLRTAGVPVIVHICSNRPPDRGGTPDDGGPLGFECEAFSAENITSLKVLGPGRPGLATVGGASPFMLDHGPARRIGQFTTGLLRRGIVDIVAPGCGLGMSTPLEHIHALTQAAKETATERV